MRGAVVSFEFPEDLLLKVTFISRSFLLASLLLGANAAAVGAQTALPAPVRTSEFETRAQLEAAATVAESKHRTSEAWLLRSRLRNGDFQEGDRIVVVLENNPRVDTVSVRAGKVIQFIGMADLSLDGVLRSELNDTMRRHLARYLKNPDVRSTPLLPIAVLGGVGAPGFYYAPADAVLRDVIMQAGGPRQGNLSRTVVRRGSETIWKKEDVRIALADGLSLDRLHLRAGDEVFVPTDDGSRWRTVLTTLSASTGLIFLLVQVFR